MGRPLQPAGRKARDHLATMDVDMATAAQKVRRLIRMSTDALVVSDPVKWNAIMRELQILMIEIAGHVEDARLERREVVEIYDAWARLNNGDGP